MVDENLTDEQQADLVRRWVRENGTFVLGGLALGLAALFGWNQWQAWRVGHAAAASAVYEELVAEIRNNDVDEAVMLLGELEADYAGSPYIDQARLRLAKSSLDKVDFETAADYLEAVVNGGGIAEIVSIARLRLARVRLQQGQHDAALAALTVAPGSAFAAQANDLRGDIYAAMGRAEDASAAYDAALADDRQPPTIDRPYVQAKRDSLALVPAAVAGATMPGPASEVDDAQPESN